MAQKMVTVVFKSRKKTEIPEANLSNVKRMFGDQIAYIEDGDDEPIIAQPIIEVVKDDEPIAVATPSEKVADMKMTASALKDLAKDLDGFNPKMNKQQLVDLING